jgi:hypothetical protein
MSLLQSYYFRSSADRFQFITILNPSIFLFGLFYVLLAMSPLILLSHRNPLDRLRDQMGHLFIQLPLSVVVLSFLCIFQFLFFLSQLIE